MAVQENLNVLICRRTKWHDLYPRPAILSYRPGVYGLPNRARSALSPLGRGLHVHERRGHLPESMGSDMELIKAVSLVGFFVALYATTVFVVAWGSCVYYGCN